MIIFFIPVLDWDRFLGICLVLQLIGNVFRGQNFDDRWLFTFELEVLHFCVAFHEVDRLSTDELSPLFKFDAQWFQFVSQLSVYYAGPHCIRCLSGWFIYDNKFYWSFFFTVIVLSVMYRFFLNFNFRCPVTCTAKAKPSKKKNGKM